MRRCGTFGAPMAPLVWGERDSTDQMRWYQALRFAAIVVDRR